LDFHGVIAAETTVITSYKVTYTDSGHPSVNYQSFPYTYLFNDPPSPSYYGYYEFDLSTFMSNVSNCVLNADVYLSNFIASTGYPDIDGVQVVVNYLNGTTWDASSLMWNNQNLTTIYASETLTFKSANLGEFMDPRYDYGNDVYRLKC